jgi:hypothetical protein
MAPGRLPPFVRSYSIRPHSDSQYQEYHKHADEPRTYPQRFMSSEGTWRQLTSATVLTDSATATHDSISQRPLQHKFTVGHPQH